MSQTSTKYEAVIGIETHVQLKTKTKLFCACDNDAREAAPNTKVCPVCMGFPGSLPVLNEQAVKLALRAGLALNAEIPVRTKFDRKNYFYPDLPHGYQITQFDQPIIGKGHVEITVEDETLRVGITRAHMEADAGKLVHPDGVDYSLVDYNRAGTPLIEIVSEPDIRSAAQAKSYAQELYNLMRYADVSEANLYYGNMRFDINVSLRPTGTNDFGTRTETKNLNSFRSIERAAEYEIKRQIEVLERGDKVVQETRGWNEAKQQTFSQRSKEEAHDYRYFPEPDLPPLVITKAMRQEAEATIPVMPTAVREKLFSVGLDKNLIEVVVGQPDFARLVMEAAEADSNGPIKQMATWLVGTVQSLMTEEGTGQILNSEFDLELKTDALMQLAGLVESGKVSQTAAKEILGNFMLESYASGDPKIDVEKITIEANLIQVSDADEIEQLVDEAIAANPKSVEDYRAGKPQALGFLVGQVMKASKGQANPPMVNELLKKKLS